MSTIGHLCEEHKSRSFLLESSKGLSSFALFVSTIFGGQPHLAHIMYQMALLGITILVHDFVPTRAPTIPVYQGKANELKKLEAIYFMRAAVPVRAGSHVKCISGVVPPFDQKANLIF